jgi:hypothetical protein
VRRYGYGSRATSHRQKVWDWAAKGQSTLGGQGEKNFCVMIIGLMCVCERERERERERDKHIKIN